MSLRLALSTTALAALCALSLPAAAQQRVYGAVLTGAKEAPPVATSAGGAAVFTFDLGAGTMRVQTTFAELMGPSTAAHIHCCTAAPFTGTAGVVTPMPAFPGFPLDVTAGSYDQTFNMTLASSYNPAFIAANGGTPLSAWNALLAGVDAGRAYFNIHSYLAPGGEIRGFLTPVPEPTSLALMLGGLGVLAGAARKRLRREPAVA